MPKMKPVAMVEGHRTKEELENRTAAEESLRSDGKMKEEPEVKVDPVAHKTFLRIKKMMKSIGKDDGMYQTVINRYCKIYSETVKLVEFRDGCEDMKEWLDLDAKISSKRKMLFDIEKENYMTLNSGMKAVNAQLNILAGDSKDSLSAVLAGDYDDI